VVTLVHTGLFLKSSDQSAVRVMSRLGPVNLVSAVLFAAGGFPHGAVRFGMWAGAFVLHWATPFLTSPSAIGLRAAHFVERHGSILLIAIGESVVSVGIGLQGRPLTFGLTVTALLGLVVSAALFWLYVDHDEDAARSLAASPVGQQAWLALNAFGYCFLALLGAVVVLAAGVKLAVTVYGRPGSAPVAWFLAGGVATYLVGLAVFRTLLRSGHPGALLGAAALALATAAAGLLVSPEAELACLAAVLVAATVVDTTRQKLSRPPVSETSE
jgi:low temperature requirement protein LtrA